MIKVSFYTSFPTYNHFMISYNFLGDAANCTPPPPPPLSSSTVTYILQEWPLLPVLDNNNSVYVLDECYCSQYHRKRTCWHNLRVWSPWSIVVQIVALSLFNTTPPGNAAKNPCLETCTPEWFTVTWSSIFTSYCSSTVDSYSCSLPQRMALLLSNVCQVLYSAVQTVTYRILYILPQFTKNWWCFMTIQLLMLPSS